MAVREFCNPEAALEATKAALSWRYSAVVIRNGVANLSDFISLHERNRERIGASPLTFVDPRIIAEAAGPLFSTVQKGVDTWFINEFGLSSSSLMRWHVRFGGIASHCDYMNEQPFVLSVGVKECAEWQTMIASDEIVEELQDNPNKYVGFEEGIVDEFIQEAGDIVFIPGFDAQGRRPSIHQIDAGEDREALLYSFDASR